MNKKITHRAVLGTVVAGLALGPFVIRSLRKGNEIWTNYEKARQEYLARLSFPREYVPRVHPRLDPNDVDAVIQTHRRYWSNYAKLRKAEFDYYAQQQDSEEMKKNSIWNMNVHVTMEYGRGFEAKGKDANGNKIDFACGQDGTIVRAAPENTGFASLMTSFFDAIMAYPEMLIGYSEIKKGVEMMPSPYVEGCGLYDVLVVHDHPTGSQEAMVKQDYFSCETGMRELRYTYIAPGVTRGRGTAEGAPGTEAEVFTACKYELINSVYLTSKIESVIPQTGFRREEQYSNFTNVELWQHS